MATIAVTYAYIDDAEKVQSLRPEHREVLRGLHEQGHLIMSGPLAGAPGALLIMNAAGEEEALSILEVDPFFRDGVIAERTAREWTVVIGEVPTV